MIQNVRGDILQTAAQYIAQGVATGSQDVRTDYAPRWTARYRPPLGRYGVRGRNGRNRRLATRLSFSANPRGIVGFFAVPAGGVAMRQNRIVARGSLPTLADIYSVHRFALIGHAMDQRGVERILGHVR